MHDDVHMNHEARLIDAIGADHGILLAIFTTLSI